MTLSAGKSKTVHIPLGAILTITPADANCVAALTQIANPVGGQNIQLAAAGSSTVTLGPYLVPTDIQIDVTSSSLTDVLSNFDLSKFGSLAYKNSLSFKSAVVAGAIAGNLTVTGILTTDVLVAVIKFPGAGTTITDLASLTSEFTISAGDTINNTGGTTTASSKVLVIYMRLA